MNKKTEAVFFCSAYNDLSYILAEIKFINYQTILVFVVNNYGVYQFLESLGVEGMKLKFLTTNLKRNHNPLHWLREFFYLHFWLRYELIKIKNLPIYFYATFYDTTSMYAAGQLKRNNKLYLGYLPDPGEYTQVGRRLYDRIISFLYLAPIHTYRGINGNIISGLSSSFIKNYINYGRHISKQELIDIQSDKSLSLQGIEPHILLLTSIEDAGIPNVWLSTENIYLSIIDQFRSEEIYIKAHPRLGMAPFLTSFKFKEIHSFIPIEFMDVSKCRMVIGISSIALCHFASKGVKTISVLNLMQFESGEIRDSNINFLKENTLQHEIFFPNTLAELLAVLKVG